MRKVRGCPSNCDVTARHQTAAVGGGLCDGYISLAVAHGGSSRTVYSTRGASHTAARIQYLCLSRFPTSEPHKRRGEKPSIGPPAELERFSGVSAWRLCKAQKEGESLIGIIAHFMTVTLSQPICSGAARFIDLGSRQSKSRRGSPLKVCSSTQSSSL